MVSFIPKRTSTCLWQPAYRPYRTHQYRRTPCQGLGLGRSALCESIKRTDKGDMLTVQLTNTRRVYGTSIGPQPWPRECRMVVSFSIHIMGARTVRGCSTQSHRVRHSIYASSTNMPCAVFGTVYHDVHRSRRAAIDSLFSKKSVKSFEPVLQEMVGRLSRVFLSASLENRPLELGSEYLALTTDAVCEHTLGRHHDLLNNQQRTRDWKKTVHAVASLTPFAKQFPWLIPTALGLQISLLRSIAPSLSKIVELQRVSCRKVQVFRADACRSLCANKPLPPLSSLLFPTQIMRENAAEVRQVESPGSATRSSKNVSPVTPLLLGISG
jgi:hypothetical protein